MVKKILLNLIKKCFNCCSVPSYKSLSLSFFDVILLTFFFKFVFSGLVPLHNACSYGHFEVTEMLIKHGADVNANDLWAFTPLHEAASKSRVEVCSLLVSEGADPHRLNCHSKSAIDVAPTKELQERLACEYIVLVIISIFKPRFASTSGLLFTVLFTI